MSLWIKICANTSLRDALLAAEAGADALGFVFAPSPRRVTVEQAAAITAQLPAGVERIGVFVDASLEEIADAATRCRLTGVQLHFEAAPELPARLRQRLGAEVRILRAVHFGPGAAEKVAALAGNPHVDAVLVDSRPHLRLGCTGVAFDWETARLTIFGVTGVQKLVAAGRTGPENVAAAIGCIPGAWMLPRA